MTPYDKAQTVLLRLKLYFKFQKYLYASIPACLLGLKGQPIRENPMIPDGVILYDFIHRIDPGLLK